MATDDTFGLPSGFVLDEGLPAIAQVPQVEPVAAPAVPMPAAPRAPAVAPFELPDTYIDAIKGFEGFTPSAKWDYKQHSIGYGTRGAPGETITPEAADARLREELSKAARIVHDVAPDAPEGVKAALTSLTFNAGSRWVTSGLGDAVRKGDYQRAREQFQRYTRAGGQELPGLVNRRAAESAWFDGGNAPDTLAGGQGADALGLPPGFQINQPAPTAAADAGLPPGFQVDAPGSKPAKAVSFTESFGRGVDQMQGMLYGGVEAAGELTGSKGLTAFGREGRERNKTEADAYGNAAEFTKIKGVGDFGQWAKETIGSQIPVMGPMLGGAIAGTIVGGPIGGVIGAFLPGFVMSTGETQGNIKDKDPNAVAPGSAFVGGAAIAALDSVLPGKVGSALVRRFGAEAAEEIAKRTLSAPVKSSMLKTTAKGVVTGMATEGITEALQEAIGDVAASYGTGKPLDPNLGTRMVEAWAGGTLLGGLMGPMGGHGNKPAVTAGGEGDAPPGAAASPAAPTAPAAAPGSAPVPAPAASSIPAEQQDVLRQMGYAPDDIASMTPEQVATELADAASQGLVPKAAPAPDAPTAEPVADILAQIEDMKDPANPRKGVYLSADNLDNLQSQPEFVQQIAAALSSPGGIVPNVDGKGGMLLAQDQATAAAVRAAVKAGEPIQSVIGAATGAGTGKPADGSVVVQQKTPAGAVTRETLTTPEGVPAAQDALAAPGRTVEAMPAADAVQRREDGIAAESGASAIPTIGDGTRKAPIKVEIPEDVTAAAKAAAADYTPAQGEANNRKLGHAKWNGLDISIETEAGGVRKGLDKKTGKEWSTTMGAAYGYIKNGATSADGMALDVYMGTDPASERVWVIDEVDRDDPKVFRQHKAMIAFPNQESAVAAYTGTSSKSAETIGAVTEMPIEQFRAWARDGKKTKPLGKIGGQNAGQIGSQAADAPTKQPARKPAKSPATALAVIRNLGGIRPDADLRQIADRTRIPGLFNKNGLTPDDMLRALEERNFIQDKSGDYAPIDTSLQDLYDLVQSIVDGERVGEYGVEVEKPRSNKSYELERLDYVEQEIASVFTELGLRNDLTDAERDRLLDLVANQNMDVVDALERISIESIENEAAADDRAGSVEEGEGTGGSVEEPGTQGVPGEPSEAPGRAPGPEEGPSQAPAAEVAQAPETGPFDSGPVPSFADVKALVKDQPKPMTVLSDYLERKGFPGWTKMTDAQRRETFADIKKMFGGEAAVEAAAKAEPAAPFAVGDAFVATKPFDHRTLGRLNNTIVRQFKAGDRFVVAKQPELDDPESAVPVWRVQLRSGQATIEMSSLGMDEYLRPTSDVPAITTEPTGQTSLVSEATTKEKIEAEAKAKSEKGKGSTSDAGELFNPDAGKQTDLVDMAKAPREPADTVADPLASMSLADLVALDVKFRETRDRGVLPAGVAPMDLINEIATRRMRGETEAAPEKQEDAYNGPRNKWDQASPTEPNFWLKYDADGEAVGSTMFDVARQKKDINTGWVALDADGKVLGYARTNGAAQDIVDGKATEKPADASPAPKVETQPGTEKPAPAKAEAGKTASPQDRLVARLLDGENPLKDIRDTRKFAREIGLVPEDATNKQIEEAVEAGIVAAARVIVAERSKSGPEWVYKGLVSLYERQPNLAARTGTSVANQAYSTPVPLAYLAGRLADVRNAAEVYEPTAGNGALLIDVINPSKVYANEIDPDRAAALKAQGFNVTSKDGAEVPSLTDIDSIIMNPPFGAVKDGGKSTVFTVGDLTTTKIDHAVVLNALEAMSDDGKAVLIIGGTKAEDAKERAQSYRGLNMKDAKTGKGKDNFYRVLYDRYGVTNHFTVSGDLYSKQGASWPVDVIVIEGRGKSKRPLPGTPQGVPALLTSWDQLSEKIPNDTENDRTGDRPTRKPVEPVEKPAPVDEVRGDEDVGTGPVAGKPEAGTKPAGVRKDAPGGQPEGGRGDAVGDGDVPAGGRGDSGRIDRNRAPRRERVKVAEGATQAKYEPVSGSQSVDTLVPASMADSSRNAMERVEQRHGNVDDFVQDALGYDADADGMFFLRTDPETGKKIKERPFSAEQIDAIASAIDNVERGDAMILGDACVAGDTRVYDPISGTHTAIKALAERGKPIKVLALTPNGFQIVSATTPFYKGEADLYRVELDDGRKITVTRQHRFLTPDGWRTLDDGLREGCFLGSAEDHLLKNLAGPPSTHLEDGPRSTDTRPSLTDDCSAYPYPCDAQPHSVRGSAPALAPSPADVLARTHYCLRAGEMVLSLGHSRPHQGIGLPSRNSSSPSGNRAPSLTANQVGASLGSSLLMTPQSERPSRRAPVALHQERGAAQPDRSLGDVIGWFQPHHGCAHPASESVSALVQHQSLAQPQLEIMAHQTRTLAASHQERHLECESPLAFGDHTGWRRIQSITYVGRDAFYDMWVPGFENYVAEGVINHNTGIGKGRVGAGMLRYAIKKGLVPVLMTEKMDLYGDMYRDMRDIGLFEMLGREPRILTTDVGKSIPLDEEAVNWKADAELAEEAGEPLPKRRGKFLSGGSAPAKDKAYDRLLAGDKDVADVVFTTYSQMQTLGEGRAVPRRRSVLNAIAPRAMMVLDETHNAGGQGVVDDNRAQNAAEGGRAEFVRELTSKAKGLLFMSATYAKRPNVMDLYARTDMGKAVEDIKDLPKLIQRGGVPMQQIVASMLAESGQYLRRERSFEGIEYAVEEANVDEVAYDQFVGSVQSIFKFDLAVKPARDEIIEEILAELGAGTKGQDGGIGEASARSTGFASIMHNIVTQMLLAIKANAAADRAIDALKAGEKPVITLANTNESFISDFAEADGVAMGGTLDIDFGDMLKRYLQRTLRVTYKKAGDKKPSHYQIPIERLPISVQNAYRQVEFMIDQGNYAGMPVSPIDWIRNRITQAGYTVREVTGRKTMLDYGRKTPALVARPKGETGSGGKRVTLAKFNAGTLDAVILNQSGSTGVSIHASKTFKDQRKRRMILAQAEANIDTHMQMLGRVNRTGQVILPAYSQLAASIPAEVRPIIVLMRKMASLSANTTGARGSAFTSEAADFMNEVGDKVMAEYLWENPEINNALGDPYDGAEIKDVVQHATGKLVLLTVAQQREMLETVQKNYVREIEQLDALGENPLEAKMLDLQAETLETVELKPKTGDSPFLDAVRIEKVTAKAQGRAMPVSDVVEKVAEALKLPKPEGSEQAALEQLEARGRGWRETESRRIQDLARRQMAEELAATKPDSREGVRSKALATLSRWQQTMNIAYPGARVSLGMPSGDLDGIVMSVERSGKAKSITALSAWTVKIAVPDSARQFEFPMSKLFPPGIAKSEDEKGATVTSARTFLPMLISAFEDARKEGRETRFIVTGNILGGYDQTGGKGRIVNFTTKDGQVRPGVLMERGFAVDKFMKSRTIRFQTGAQIASFIDKVSDVEVSGRDGDLVLGKGRYGYYIQMAKARGKAGKYYTDKAVRATIAPKEFAARGNRMIAEDLGRDQFVRAVEEMKKVGAQFETDTAQDEAQAIIAESQPASSLTSLGTHEVRVIRQIERRLAAGRTTVIPDATVRSALAAIQPDLDLVPPGTVVGAISKIAPDMLHDDHVLATFTKPDGKTVTARLAWDKFKTSNALFLPGKRPALVLLHFGESLDARKVSEVVDASLGLGSENEVTEMFRLGDLLRSRFRHEIVHLLRTTRALEGARWRRLVDHANSLDLLAMDVTRPASERVMSWQMGIEPVQTLRDAYTQIYARYDNPQELIDQESVAALVEQSWLGGLSDADVAPVRDILDDIAKGNLRGRSASADVSGPLFSLRGMAVQDAQVGQSMRRDLDSLGYYSKALEAARGLKQAKGTPEQMLAQLKSAGVKDAEIEATGLGEFLKGKAGSTAALESDAITLSQKRFDPSTLKRYDIGAFDDEIASRVPTEPRAVGDYNLVVDKTLGYLNYELVPKGKTSAYDKRGNSISLGRFAVKSGQNGGVEITNSLVRDDLQRQGLGSKVYDIIEADVAPAVLMPSPWNQLSPFAVSFWAKRSPEKLAWTRQQQIDSYEGDRHKDRIIPTYPQPQGDRTAFPPRRASLKQVTKAEIIKHLEENRVQVKEVRYGGEGVDGMGGDTVDAVKASVLEQGQPLFSSIPSAKPSDGLTAAARAKKGDLARDMAEAVNIVNRMTGLGAVDVSFRDSIPIVGISAEALQSARDMGIEPVAQGVYHHRSLDAKALIELSTGVPNADLRTTAGHEAYHHVEIVLATPQELKLLRSPSEMARARNHAAVEIGRSIEEVTKLPDYEIRAIAFQRYRRLREEGAPLSPLHIGVRRAWDRMVRVFQNVRNALRGQGFDSMESIFERARTGEMVYRQAAAKIDARPPFHAIPILLPKQVRTTNYISREPFDLNKVREVARYTGDVPLGAIYTVQKGVSPSGAKAKLRNFASDGPVSVFKWGNAYYVNDGNHRIEAARAQGRASIIAEVIELGPKDPFDGSRVVVGRGPADLPAQPVGAQEVDPGTAALASFFPTATSSGTFLGRKVAATMRRMTPSQETTDALRVRIQDKFLPMRRQQEAIERQTGVDTPLPLDVYVAESLYHGRAGERASDLQQKHVEPLIEFLRKNEITGDQLGDYLYARHAKERNNFIATLHPPGHQFHEAASNEAIVGGSGVSNRWARELLDEVATGPKAQAFTDAAKMVDAINVATRDMLLSSGLISREVYDAWSTDYQHYVPLRGFEIGNDDNPEFPRVGKGYNVRGPEAHRALGRRSVADNPVAYVLLQAQQAIVRSEKNRVNKTLLRLVQAHPDPDVWQVYKGEYRRKLNETTGLVETVFVPPQFSRDDPSIVGVKVGGKQQYIQIHNPNLARALRGVGSSDLDHAIVRNMMAVTRMYAQLLTSWNPEFVVGNFFRDVQTAVLNSKDVKDLPPGARKQMLTEALSLTSIRSIYNALRGDGSAKYAQYFDEFRLAGGKISFLEYNDVQRIKDRIETSFKAGNIRRSLRQAGKYVEDLNTSVENGVRLSTYVAMRKAGIPKDRAAYVARELTVNFNRKGEWGPVINAAYMFFNASVQGSTRVLQAAKSKAVRRAIYAIVAGGAAVEILNYMIAGDDKDKENAYDKIKPWIKERNMIFMLPGRTDYIQIPMPYGYNVPYVAGQKIGELARTVAGHGKLTPAKAAAGIMQALMGSFNPLGTDPSVSFLQMMSPTLLDPVVQVAENKTWYGGPIFPVKFDRNKPDSESYFNSVHPLFIEVAKRMNAFDLSWIGLKGGNAARSGWLDVSPEVLEHYAQFVGGGIGKFVLNATGSAQRALSGEEFVPEKTPIIRRLYGKQTLDSRRRDFFEAWTQVDAAHYEVIQLNKARDPEGMNAARKEWAPELQAYGAMKGAQKSLSEYGKLRAQIQLNKEMSDADKKAKLDDIKERENALILRVLEVYNRAKKQAGVNR